MSQQWEERPGPGDITDVRDLGPDSPGGRGGTWYEDPRAAEPPGWDGYAPGPAFAAPPGPQDAWQDAWQDDSQDDWDTVTKPVRRPPGRPGSGRRRCLKMALTALVAAALVAGLAVITLRPHDHPAAQTRAAATGRPGQRASTAVPASQDPAGAAVAQASAQKILAAYLARNNAANQSRSSSLLASIEGGTSYLIDAGAYRWERADPSASRYAPLTFASPRFFIPPAAGYPEWFAVRGTWVKSGGSPEGAAWLVFARKAAGAPWLEVLEPDIITGAPAIRIATGPGGYAIPVGPSGAAGLAVAPDSIQRVTAAYLDTGAGNVAGFTAPGDLQDLTDEAYWRAKLPAGSADTDRHSPTGDPVFGLRTAGGGALEFFDLSATLTLTLPAGDTAGFQIPGYYAAGDPVSAARVPYADQFAVDVPPGGAGQLQVVADDGGVASRD